MRRWHLQARRYHPSRNRRLRLQCVSEEEVLSQGIRSNSGRLDGYKLPMSGNMKLVNCFMYPASVFAICTLSFHMRAGDSHGDFNATPGTLVIKIHSTPSSLSAEVSHAMTRGTGMEVFFWTNWSIATCNFTGCLEVWVDRETDTHYE
jgi:hypothetical protein